MQKRALHLLVPFLDQILVSGGNFLTVILCARALPAIEQGKLGYAITFYLATLVLNVPLIFQWANVHAPAAPIKERYEAALAALQCALAPLWVLGVFLFLIGGTAITGWDVTTAEMMGLSAFLLLQQHADYIRRAGYVFERPSDLLVASTLNFGTRIGLLLIATPADFLEAVILLCIGATFPIFLYARYVSGWMRATESVHSLTREIATHLRNTGLMPAVGPINWLWNNIPIIALGSWVGLGAVGVFITVRSIANVANVFIEMLETTVAARVGQILGNRDHSTISLFHGNLHRVGIAIWLAGLVVFILFGEQLLQVLIHRYYRSEHVILLLFWIIQGATFIFRLDAVVLRSKGNVRIVLTANLLALVASGSLAVWLVPEVGRIGAALVLLGACTLNATYQRIALRRLALAHAGP